MADHPISRALTRVGTLTARPAAFLVWALFAAAWIVFSPETLEWHGVATLATWLMTLFIQRAEHRDTQAIQAKLDELVRIHAEARDRVITIDEEEPEAIERIRRAGRRGRKPD